MTTNPFPTSVQGLFSGRPGEVSAPSRALSLRESRLVIVYCGSTDVPMDMRPPKLGPRLKGLSPMMGLRGILLSGLKSGLNLERLKPSLVISPSKRGPRGSELRLDEVLILRFSTWPLVSELLESRGGRSRTVCGAGG